MSYYRNVLLPKCPVTEMSCYRNVMLPKCPVTEMSVTKTSITKVSFTEMSRYQYRDIDQKGANHLLPWWTSYELTPFFSTGPPLCAASCEVWTTANTFFVRLIPANPRVDPPTHRAHVFDPPKIWFVILSLFFKHPQSGHASTTNGQETFERSNHEKNHNYDHDNDSDNSPYNGNEFNNYYIYYGDNDGCNYT